MPLYFFNRADGHYEPDREGLELPDLETAREEAIVYLGETIKDRPGMLKKTGEFRVEVTAEDGTLLTTIIVHSLDAVCADTIEKLLRS